MSKHVILIAAAAFVAGVVFSGTARKLPLVNKLPQM